MKEELFKGKVDIQREQNAPVVTVFPLEATVGTLEPGAYYVTVKDAGDISEASMASKIVVITAGIETAREMGQGHGPVNHFVAGRRFWQEKNSVTSDE